MRRRQFIAGLGSAAAWSLAVRAQEPSSVPVVGVLAYAAFEDSVGQIPAFKQGLAETGFVDGKNVMFEYRFANYEVDRLPAFAAELVSRRVAVIHPTALSATLAAKAATQTIPISFAMGADPVELGIVASLSRPGGNITGVTNRGNELARKRLELLHEVAPFASVFALLINPANPISRAETRETEAAAAALGGRLVIVNASKPDELEKAFAEIAAQRAGALVVGVDTLFLSFADRIAALAARHGVPAIYGYSRAAKVGGLMTYSTDLLDLYRLAGIYAGRILKGEKPADLPVQLSTKVELVINLNTARALGLAFPLPLLGRADEVIE
jgi:putative ABC transport system substrate-binding protein